MEDEESSFLSITSTDLSTTLSEKNRRKESAAYVFNYMLITQIILYFESGAVPCLLEQMSVAADMSADDQGKLGGIVYLALSIASPFCGYLFKMYNPKIVLGCSLVFNNLFILLFACTPMNKSYSSTMLIASRALIGFTQAFVSVYSPLWVDGKRKIHE